jgi:endo-1,4-beta-xylanase
VNVDALRTNPKYESILIREFSSITPENCMKWEALQPRDRGEWDFEASDCLVQWAEEHHMRVRGKCVSPSVSFVSIHPFVISGHCLVWHNALPAWVQSLSAEDLRESVRAHITAVVSRYRGRIQEWDVVNEGACWNDIWRVNNYSVFSI